MVLEPLTYTEQLEDDTVDMLATIALITHYTRNFSFTMTNKVNIVKALWPSLHLTKVHEIVEAMNKQENINKFFI